MTTSSGLLDQDGGQPLTAEETITQTPTPEVYPDGTICTLYNQQSIANGTKCKVECFLPSTAEYIVILLNTNSRMFVSSTDVRKIANSSREPSPPSHGQDTSSPTAQKLLSATKRSPRTQTSDSKYEQMGRQYSTARKSIVCFVVLGIVVILVGLILYIQPADGPTNAGIALMSIGVLVIIVGVLRARFHNPQRVDFASTEISR